MSFRASFIPFLPPVLTWLGNDAQTATATTYTFTSKTLGPSSGDRMIIVGAGGGESNVAVSTITANGVSLPQIVHLETGASLCTAIHAGIVPSGATGDIVVTFTGSQGASCNIGWWAATGNFSFLDSKTSIASPGTFTLTSKAGGFCIGYFGYSNAGLNTSTWTPNPPMTKRFDAITTGTQRYSGADGIPTGTTQVVTDTYGAGGGHVLVGVSYG